MNQLAQTTEKITILFQTKRCKQLPHPLPPALNDESAIIEKDKFSKSKEATLKLLTQSSNKPLWR